MWRPRARSARGRTHAPKSRDQRHGAGRHGAGRHERGGGEGPAIEGRYDSLTRWTRLFATNAAAQAFCEIPRGLRRDAAHPHGSTVRSGHALRALLTFGCGGAVVKVKVKLVRAVRACASVLLLLLVVVGFVFAFLFCLFCLFCLFACLLLFVCVCVCVCVCVWGGGGGDPENPSALADIRPH
jgi:hypothetical protein